MRGGGGGGGRVHHHHGGDPGERGVQGRGRAGVQPGGVGGGGEPGEVWEGREELQVDLSLRPHLLSPARGLRREGQAPGGQPVRAEDLQSPGERRRDLDLSGQHRHRAASGDRDPARDRE